jgi:hypothetical protein
LGFRRYLGRDSLAKSVQRLWRFPFAIISATLGSEITLSAMRNTSAQPPPPAIP